MRPEPRAVVRSTLPEAKPVLSAPVRTVVHGAVRRPVSGEAGIGDARSAAATSTARSAGARMTRPEFGIVSGRNARRGGLFAKRSAE